MATTSITKPFLGPTDVADLEGLRTHIDALIAAHGNLPLVVPQDHDFVRGFVTMNVVSVSAGKGQRKLVSRMGMPAVLVR